MTYSFHLGAETVAGVGMAVLGGGAQSPPPAVLPQTLEQYLL